jgi:predicted hydrocarbon binding protein
MKGVIFNLLEQVVAAQHGAETWEGLLDTAGARGVYTAVGSYEDAELEALLAAATTTLGVTRAEALRWFGRAAMPELATRYPGFFTPHQTGRTFVLGLNSVVHAEVRKLYVGAGCPRFDIREDGPALFMGYHSPRRMCALAHGFLEGLADRYGETVEVEHVECVEHADARCLIRSEWRTPA